MMRLLFLICSVLLFIGVGEMSDVFYYCLRILISIVAIDVIITDYDHGSGIWALFFSLILLVFNPILPIGLETVIPRFIFCSTAAILFGVRGVTWKS